MTVSKRESLQRSNTILVWPTSTSDLDVQHGYVLGWEDKQQESSLVATRTTICAGIVPIRLSVGTETFVVHEERIGKVLEIWAKQFECIGGEHQRKEIPETTKGECFCVSCVCIKRFKLVALWCQSESDLVKETELLRIVPTNLGPWWKQHDEESSSSAQLLIFDPCDVLSYYRQSAPWSPSDFDGYCVTGFVRTLLRMSEAKHVFDSFQTILESDLASTQSHEVTATPPEGSSTTEQLGTKELATHHDQILEHGKDESCNLSKQLRKAVIRTSMLARHWSFNQPESYAKLHRCRSIPSLLRPFPLACLLWLLFDLKVSSKQDLYRRQTVMPFVPSQLASKTAIAQFEVLSKTAVDSFLGMVSGVLIWSSADTLLGILGNVWNSLHNRMLRDNIGWLETFPAGFKLNVPLTTNMGSEINLLVDSHDWITSLLLKDTTKRCMLLVTAGFGMLFGLLALLALVFDVIRIFTIHIAVFANCFRSMHRAQLYLLSSLWLLFRGKKRNVLRHRNDTMEYDSTQLLLGVVLFSMLLFLFTTILVYYAFFTALYLLVLYLLVTTWAVFVSVKLFPLGTCILRVCSPGWFTESIYLQEQLDPTFSALCGASGQNVFVDDTATDKATKNKRSVTRLTPVPQTLSAIITRALQKPLVALASTIPCFVWAIISGLPFSILQECLDSVGN